MMKRVQCFGIAAAALALSTASGWAQPPAPTAPEDAAQAAQRVMDEMQQRQARQQQQTRARRDENWQRSLKSLRDSMGRAGFGDRSLQNAVLDFVEEQDLAREEVREAAAACLRALDDQQLDDPQVQKLLDAYQAATTRAQAKRDASLVQLDAQIHFSTNPRLRAFLSLRSLVGNEAQFTKNALPDFGGAMDFYELQEIFPPRPKPKPDAPIAQ